MGFTDKPFYELSFSTNSCLLVISYYELYTDRYEDLPNNLLIWILGLTDEYRIVELSFPSNRFIFRRHVRVKVNLRSLKVFLVQRF